MGGNRETLWACSAQDELFCRNVESERRGLEKRETGGESVCCGLGNSEKFSEGECLMDF